MLPSRIFFLLGNISNWIVLSEKYSKLGVSIWKIFQIPLGNILLIGKYFKLTVTISKIFQVEYFQIENFPN